MCEYCGCQALAAIDELTREHDLATLATSDWEAVETTRAEGGSAPLVADLR